MADGALRLTLDLSADKVQIAAKLMKAKQLGLILEVAAVAVKSENIDDTTGKSREIHI
jgi:hypothetical protein